MQPGYKSACKTVSWTDSRDSFLLEEETSTQAGSRQSGCRKAGIPPTARKSMEFYRSNRGQLEKPNRKREIKTEMERDRQTTR